VVSGGAVGHVSELALTPPVIDTLNIRSRGTPRDARGFVGLSPDQGHDILDYFHRAADIL